MKLTKICPYCKKTFTTEKNSRKYCKKSCVVRAQKLRAQKVKSHLCQWCGHIFAAARKRKFCSRNCHVCYKKELGLIYKTKIKIPVKITLSQADRESKAEGITYGTFVTLHKLK